MKVWVQLLHEKRQLVDINEKGSLEDAFDVVSKVFNIQKENNKVPVFLHYGHMLTGPQPFKSIQPNSRLIFFTEDKNKFNLILNEEEDLHNANEEEDIADLNEEEEDDNVTLFTSNDLNQIARDNNSIVQNAIRHFAENMHFNTVLNENNTIFNEAENLSQISEILSNNRSNFVPLIEYHQMHPLLTEVSEEEVFSRISLILDVQPIDEEDDLFAKLDQMTARQRSLVDNLCKNSYNIHDAVDALERTNFDINAAIALLGSRDD